MISIILHLKWFTFDNNNQFIRLTSSDDVIGYRTKNEVNEIMIALRDDESLRVNATDS